MPLFARYALFSTFCLCLYLLPKAVLASEYVQGFESCIDGETLPTCDTRELGAEYWNASTISVQATTTYLGSLAGLGDTGATDYFDIDAAFPGYDATNSIVSFSYYLNLEDKDGYAATWDSFGLTGMGRRIIWDASEHFDVKSYDGADLLAEEVFHSAEWINVSGSVNCFTSEYDITIGSYSGTGTTSAHCVDAMQLNFYFGNYPGRASFDSLSVSVGDYFSTSTVTIVELPEPDDVFVQVGSLEFNFDKNIYCYLDQTDCVIGFDYSFDDIGADVFLLEAGEETLLNYIDAELDLADQIVLHGELSPTIRSTEVDNEYWIAVINLAASSSAIYETATVHWIATTTDDIDATNFIIKHFKQTFPLSIYLQLRNDLRAAEAAGSARAEITFNDIIPAEFSGYQSSTTILSAELLEDNLSVWSLYFYPAMQAIVYIFCALICFFEVYFIFKTNQ